MMKSLHLTILAAALMCSLTCGCDAFRSLAGRPTTKEILAKAERGEWKNNWPIRWPSWIR